MDTQAFQAVPEAGEGGLGLAVVALDGSALDEELAELIDHSYEQVAARLTRAQRNRQTGCYGAP